MGEEKGRKFAQTYDITAGGNYEGVNIPNLLKSNDLTSNFADGLKKLYDYRKNRTKLHLDNKILLSWNALIVAALSMLNRVLHNEKYLNATVNAQMFIEKKSCNGTQLSTSWRGGKRSENSFLDDYDYYIAALIKLYNTTLDVGYL